MSRLTHLDAAGRARMVDVGAKAASERLAIADGSIRMLPGTLERIHAGRIAKGDVLAVADVAAVMAAKRTADLIPLCHSLALTGVDVDFHADSSLDAEGRAGLHVEARVRCVGQTGVEMEALTAVSAACLTIYDMLKAIDRAMTIENIAVVEKHGGASGDYVRKTP